MLRAVASTDMLSLSVKNFSSITWKKRKQTITCDVVYCISPFQSTLQSSCESRCFQTGIGMIKSCHIIGMEPTYILSIFSLVNYTNNDLYATKYEWHGAVWKLTCWKHEFAGSSNRLCGSKVNRFGVPRFCNNVWLAWKHYPNTAFLLVLTSTLAHFATSLKIKHLRIDPKPKVSIWFTAQCSFYKFPLCRLKTQ